MRRRLLSVSFILVPLVAIGSRLLAGPRTVDDAFITYRYAQNFLAGNGLVYNPGEWILGTTTPLYTLLLSGIGFLTAGSQSNFPVISLVVNSFADALTCYLLIRVGESLARPFAGLSTALIWAIAPMSVTFAIGGMETSLLVLLMMSTFYFYVGYRSTLSALFASLTVLTRPDALIFVAPIAIERAIRWLKKDANKPTISEVLAIGLPLAIWTLISWAIYGSPVPNSINAKISAYMLPRDAALIRLLQHFATPFFGQELFGAWWIGLGLLLFPTLFITGWRRVISMRRHLWPYVIYPGIYFLIFAVANPLLFRWYLTPPLPIYFLGIFLGVSNLTGLMNKKWISPLALVFSLALTLNAWTLEPDHGPDRPAPDMAFIELESVYRKAADKLLPRLTREDTLAAGDIGVLGYKTGAYILDTVGLITPRSNSYYPLPQDSYVINYAIPTDLILDQQPEFLVALEVYGRETFLKNEPFNETYNLIATIDTNIYGSEGMLIFERR